MNLAGSVDVTPRLLGMCLAAVAVGLLVMGVLWSLLKRDTARSFTPRRFTSRFMVLGGLAYLGAVTVPVGDSASDSDRSDAGVPPRVGALCGWSAGVLRPGAPPWP